MDGRVLEYLLAGLLFYLIGSIPFSYLLARSKGIDLRKVGSGNVGATNVGRALGRCYWALALLLDLGKGLVAAWLARLWGLPLWLAGLAVIGHDWSLFLHFTGGKGVATTLGVLAMTSWEALLIALFTWLLLVKLSGYASVASLSALASAPPSVWALTRSPALTGLFVGLWLLSLYRHRENLRRLVRGEEHRAFS